MPSLHVVDARELNPLLEVQTTSLELEIEFRRIGCTAGKIFVVDVVNAPLAAAVTSLPDERFENDPDVYIHRAKNG